jgi:hypothetical protein
MLALGRRARVPRMAMWGTLWRIEALLEGGRLAAAAEELAPLRVAVERVGGPVSAWHLDRITACVAQAQGRFAEAASAGRRGFERMGPVEPGPASGAYFSLLCALAGHVGPGEDAAPFVERAFVPLPLFRTLWESKAHADRFFAETLPPSLVKALGPEPVGMPETIGFEVTDAYLREAVA